MVSLKSESFCINSEAPGQARDGESEVSTMQNQHNEQKKSRNQNPAPQDCKHPQSKKQEQPQDKTGDPNRH